MKTNDLLLLIKNLSKSDKKKVTTLVEKKDRNMSLFLYRELENLSQTWDPEKDAGKEYDDFLEIQLKRNKIKTSLATLRSNTAEMILKALRLLNEGQNKREEIDIHIRNAAILEHRGLLHTSAQMLNEALDMAIDYQYHALALDIVTVLIRVESQLDFKSYGDAFKGHLLLMQQLVSYLEVESNNFVEYYHSFLLLRLGGFYSKPEALSEVDQEQPPTTFFSRLNHLQALATDAIYRQNSKDACRYSEQMLELWQEKEYLKKDRLGLYVRHVFNYLSFCSVEKEFRFYTKYLDELKEILKSGNAMYDLEAELQQGVLFAEQLYFINTDQMEAAVEMFPSIQKAIIQYKSKISKARVITFHFNQTLALFALNKYKEALDTCTDMVAIESQTHRHDLQNAGKILEIILHFELKDHEYLDRMVKRLEKPLENADQGRDFERIALRNLHKLAKIQVGNKPPDQKKPSYQQQFEVFHQELLQFKTDAPSQLRAGFFETLCWVQAKVEGETFREMLRRN